MPRYGYERLSALDHSFLLLERPNTPMHVASTALYEVGPLRTADGGVDIERVKKSIAAVLHRIPRYRQKLAWVPLERSPVWVDDDGFSLDYHIRHTSLPLPGDDDQLRALSARVMAQRLDRARPLWELWVVEGLAGERFAVISKVHHCMIDGVSGVDLMNVMMSPFADVPEVPESPPFVPRTPPQPLELLRFELGRRLRLPLDVIRDSRKLFAAADDTRRDIALRLRAAAETLGATLRAPSVTPLNQPVGPHRRFDWLVFPVAEIKRIRRGLGGSVNDVVLTIVTGAVRRFLQKRHVSLEALDFRVMAPVSVRKPEERGAFGNRVSAWFVTLPLAEPDPRAQLDAIAARTTLLKESKSAVGAELLTRVAEWTPATLLALGARNLTRLQPFNLVVTNVPGPQLPLYMLGARMTEIFPMVPLTELTGLGIALFSYDGKLCWGFNADYELLPDLADFVGFVRDAFDELLALASAPPAKARRSRAKPRVAEG